MAKKSENITVKPVSNIINICINVIIPVIYGIWTGVIIPYCGKKLSILNNDSEFTFAGIIIVVISTIVYLIIFIGYNIYQSYKTTTISTKEYNDKLQQIKNYEAKVFAQKADLHLNEIVLHSININCEEKSKTLSAIINQINSPNYDNLYYNKIISNPENQIFHILNNMATSISELCDINVNSLSITACVKLLNDDWRWITGLQPTGSVDFEQLHDNKSMFQHMLNTGEKYIFFNDKADAIKAQCYISDGNDDSGSIIGRRILLKTSMCKSAYIDFMYYISTYNDVFIVSSKETKDIKKIKNILSDKLFSLIDKRITIELQLHFINNYKK